MSRESPRNSVNKNDLNAKWRKPNRSAPSQADSDKSPGKLNMVYGLEDSAQILNEIHDNQLNRIREQIDLLNDSDFSECSPNSGASNDAIFTEVLTPRRIEVPTKKICFGLRSSDNRHKSIWTETISPKKQSTDDDWESISPKSNYEEYYLNVPHSATPSLPLEPNIIVLNESPSISSSTSLDKLAATISTTGAVSPKSLCSACSTIPLNIVRSTRIILDAEPNILRSSKSFTFQPFNNKINVEEIAKKYSTGPKLTYHYKNDSKDKLYLKKFCQRPSTGVLFSNTFTIAAITNTSKAITSGFRKLLNMGRRGKGAPIVPVSDEAITEEELEYFPDETVVRLINYSDYDLPLRKVNQLPDTKSTKNIITNLAGDMFVRQQDDCSGGDPPRPAGSFKKIVETMKYDEAMLQPQYLAVHNVFTERKHQATDMDFYNMDKGDDADNDDFDEECIEVEDVGEEERVGKQCAFQDGNDSDQGKKGCCNLKSCMEFIFPTRTTERFFY